ncbi:MAG TPA: HWE histidine kinase domain-containing protein [Devosia sp.]|nr:HWE histidine kinase domain-containing protein [Devosia sp.]
MAKLDIPEEPALTPEALSRLAAPEFRDILNALPAAIYTTDTDGIVTSYNQAAADLAGRRPVIGVDRWCVTWRLYHPDGRPLPLDQCPMAVALRERQPVRGVEVIAERPDGTRIPAMPFPTPMYDDTGEFIGGVNMLVDLSRLKGIEAFAERRVQEQHALYRFTDRLYRAECAADTYEAALDAILGALHCDRASVLLFDGKGVMRFVATRGLSPAYCAAVDGHSPWKPGQRDPQPIFVSDIMLSSESDAVKQAVRTEGISALGFIPLVAGGVVIGKFMTYHNEPHIFSAAEQDLAVTIARQLGFSIERQRTENELRENGERLRVATQAGKVGLWDWDIPGDRIVWTDSLYAVHGISKEAPTQTFAEWIGRVHPDDRKRVEQAIFKAQHEDAPYEIEMRTLRPDGQETWVFTHAVVLHEGGKPKRMVGASVDITQHKQDAHQRDLLVAELSHRVKNTLASVVTIARQSYTPGTTVEAARAAFEGRVRALAQTHTRLAESDWAGVSLDTMLADELAPYRGEKSDVVLDGPAISFPPRIAVMLGMAFHELATNAAKYGALSRPGGMLRVGWRLDGDALQVEWAEAGGPPVSPPSRSGFGRLLLERALAADLKGSVRLEFPETGLTCRLAVPLESGAMRSASLTAG